MEQRKFLLVDIYNIFFRLVYAIQEKDLELKSALVLNAFFTMMKYLGQKLEPDHMVICSEGAHNWRKKLSAKYKLNRKEKMENRTMREITHDNMMLDVLNEFLEFMDLKTNVSVLRCEEAEADDMIARFCFLHPNDKITICSVDNDFIQLVSKNVSLYNGSQKVLITNTGVLDIEKNKFRMCSVDAKGKLTIKKDYVGIEQPLQDDWIEYALFCKCIRGDSSDNIFPAYPKVRANSTNSKGVKKVGLNEAFEHRKSQDFEWINFMNQTWKDENGNIRKVEDEYKKNQILIDFNYIPIELKEKFDNYIQENLKTKPKSLIGINLMQFFNKHSMIRQLDYINNFTDLFSKTYKG